MGWLGRLLNVSLCEVMARGICGCLCSVGRAYLGEDVADVANDSVMADV